MTQLILHRDEAGESKRFAFVTYADKESTNACLEKLDGLEVAGKALAVRLALPHPHGHLRLFRNPAVSCHSVAVLLCNTTGVVFHVLRKEILSCSSTISSVFFVLPEGWPEKRID